MSKFAPGVPVGDHHTWVRPEPVPCPSCECCSAQLCQTARERRLPCDLVGRPDPDVHDLSACPCAALEVARRLLARGAVEPTLAAAAGHLVQAARYAILGGLSAGVLRDPASPESPVLVIDIPPGRVSWHLPRVGVHPDAMHYYLACGFPELFDAPVEIDEAERHRRVVTWARTDIESGDRD